MKNEIASLKVTVESIEMYVDGSGAPAFLRCGEYAASFNCAGNGARMGTVHGPVAWRSPVVRKAAIGAMLATYQRFLRETGDEWHAMNRAMYA